jgi:hypothetical protein
MFIEKITTPRIKKNGEQSKQVTVLLRYQCDFCEITYDKKPCNSSHSASGLTYCSRKCRGESIRVGKKGYNLTKKKMLELYGIENLMQLEETRNKIKQTLLKRYGVENPMNCEEFKERRKRTNVERYGHAETFQSPEMCAKREITWIKKYNQKDPRGQPHLQEVARKNSLERMAQHPYKWSSKIENTFAVTLAAEFGNIIRQKRVNRWPIDFYIPAIDTYVQLDGVYWHGLDRPIEEIRESKKSRDIARAEKWEQDRRQNEWFLSRYLRLVRVTDLEVKAGTALMKIQRPQETTDSLTSGIS